MPTLDQLSLDAASCTACHLNELGTQTVFGEGPPSAERMLVGEQPGDVEDRRGRPFVGPAGAVLDRALAEAQIDRERVCQRGIDHLDLGSQPRQRGAARAA